MTYSTAIDEAVKTATEHGNSVLEISTGWTKVKEVVYMKGPLSDELREVLSQDTRLRAYSVSATPHDKAHDGYVDDIEQVVISFPK